jgi:hypothetical protein
MKPFELAITALSLSIFDSAIYANDGAAGLAGGELHFKNLQGIQMASEDLFISPQLVKVEYKFRNTTLKPITTLISFPIRADILLDNNWDTNSKNPNEFAVEVDGKQTPFQTKIKRSEDTLQIDHFFWEQIFPASTEVKIVHTYQPIFERGVAYSLPSSEGTWTKDLETHFCASKKETNAVAKKIISSRLFPISSRQQRHGTVQLEDSKTCPIR